MSRALTAIHAAQPTSDGAGVRLFRSLGTPALSLVDPFLMLDEFRSDNPGDYIAGFPPHPHRGFETVTYMLAGAMEHRDSVGNTGELVGGSLQWMTAGRGIIHSEMPRQTDGLMWGFQLWVNLAGDEKMKAPRYQDIAPEAVPVVALPGGGAVRVLAGGYGGAVGPVQGVSVAPLMLDVAVGPNESVDIPIVDGHAGFMYTFEGAVRVGDSVLPTKHIGVLGGDGSVRVEGGPDGGRALLLAAAPIGEPVARYGPFVMNTRAEIDQAIRDYQAGRMGT